MEAALKKLVQQEEKYTAELNNALQQYAELKEQSAEFAPDELQDARLTLRPAMERSAVDRVQSVREFLRKKQQQKPQGERSPKQAHREQVR